MSNSAKALMLDEDKSLLKLYRHFLGIKGYDVFTTDNPYKLLLYGREIKPEIVIMDVNLPRQNHWELLRKINNEPWMKDVPIVIMSADNLPADKEMNGVSNLITKQHAIEKIIEILDIYSHGNKNHDIFIVSDYAPDIEKKLSNLRNKNHQYFIVHDIKGIKKYLTKNQPKKIAIKYTPERFNSIKNIIPFNNAFRVDSIAEIQKMIKDIK